MKPHSQHHRRRRHRTFAVVALLGALLSAITHPVGAQQSGSGSGSGSEEPEIASGREAIAVLGSDLDTVAADNGLTATELKAELRADETLNVDSNGELFYIDPLAPGEPTPSGQPESAPTEAAPPTTDPVFSLHSRPGADHTIYLDFDGHTTSGTSWNTAYGIDPIVSPAYNISGTVDTWSASEINRIRDIWNRVVEDYSPFDVDVTTEEPTVDKLRRTGGGDTQWGVRVVLTADTWALCGCGGHAYIGAFDDYTDEPAFVYNSSLAGAAEAASHEVGHTLLLAHDGTSSVSYYQGHGSGATGWAPLMGASYYKSVTQWSKGDYHDANNNTSSANYGNGADDLAVISSLTNGNGFGYRPDDHGDTIASATSLTGPTISESGVIETTDDIDVFAFSTGGGNVSIELMPWAGSANLDINARLLDGFGTEIAASNPSGALEAAFDQTLPTGTYYVAVDGTGAGTPLVSPPSGYSDHASLGQYSLSGTIQDSPPPPSPGAISGIVTEDETAAPLSGMRVVVHGPLPADTTVAADTLTATGGAYTVDDLPAGRYLVAFEDPTGDHEPEFFNNAATKEDAAEIVVEWDSATTVDASLAPVDEPAPCTSHDFSDVPPWVESTVVWAACNGHMNGFDGLFMPTATINRAQVANLLYNVAGSPDVSALAAHGFSDVPVWVDDAVTWLVGNGHATGYDTNPPTFKPLEPITRAAVSRMLFRIEGSPPGSPASAFTDVPPWVTEAVDWITDPANTPPFAIGFGSLFKPLDDINRAQTTRMVCRINTPPGTC